MAAHPRVSGENFYPSFAALAAFGSSPRERGKRSSERGER